jgi:hypothetical protein
LDTYFHREGIQVPVVYTKAPRVIFLADQQHRQSIRAGASRDDAIRGHLSKLFLYFIQLR